jgi:CRISPR/Cas system endoribonuclease Cas6 (RAMP superfamily)
MNIAEAFVDVFHWLFLNNKEFYHNTLFATHITEWLHFEAVLQWRYLSELFVTSYEIVGKSKRMSPKNSL